MVVLYITWVMQQKIKFCLQGIVHMNCLKTSVQAEIEIRTLSTSYIALIGKKRKKRVIILGWSFPAEISLRVEFHWVVLGLCKANFPALSSFFKRSRSGAYHACLPWISASREHEDISELIQDSFYTSNHYILNLLIGLASSWKHMRRGQMGNWLYGLQKHTRDTTCLLRRTC